MTRKAWSLGLFTFLSSLFFSMIMSFSPRSLTLDLAPEQMTPAEIYARCYAKLVRLPIANDNPTLAVLRSGTLSDAETACETLLNKASLSSSSGLLADPNDLEAKAILNTMQLVHHSWFQSTTPVVRRGVSEFKLLYDIDEPSLYWTRALFQQNIRADSVLKYNKSIKSRRLRNNSATLTNFQSRSIFNYSARVQRLGADGITYESLPQREPYLQIAYRDSLTTASDVGTNYSALSVDDAALSGFGELIGVTDQPSLLIPRLSLPGVYASTDTEMRNTTGGPNFNVNLHSHLGGGILGSLIYAYDNTNLDINVIPNSYSLIDRRFASRIFQDLLCYQLPVLDPDDVTTLVKPNSNFTFQQSQSCMQCHATIDEFALMLRNNVWVSSSTSPGNFPNTKPAPIATDPPVFNPGPPGTEAITRFTFPSLTAPNPAGTTIPFVQTPPQGTLRFRTFSRQKIEIPISNFIQVGNSFADLEDFYTCAAKRYYQYFTGVDVLLGTPPENALAQKHYDKVIKLGQDLKADPQQKLRQVIVEIFKSEAFQSRNFQTEGTGP